MSGPYRQATKYGVLNPYGTDIMEGDWIHFLTKDNEEVRGILVEALLGSFEIRTPDEEEKEYSYEDIKKIYEDG